MELNIVELTEDILEKNFISLSETLENLKGVKQPDIERMKRYLAIINGTGKIFVAQRDDGEIIGAIRVQISPTLIRGGAIGGKIEEITIRKGSEGLGIGTKLMHKAIEYLEVEGVYKITLSCRKFLVGYYEKFGFENYSINMKKYLKK